MQMSRTFAEVVEKYGSHPEFIGIEITDPNQPGAVDDTLLHLTARTGALEDMEVLIAAGAKIDSIGDLGNTPLHQAAMMGQLEAVKTLLKYGADLTIKNEFGQTPVEVAEIGEYADVAKVLKSHVE